MADLVIAIKAQNQAQAALNSLKGGLKEIEGAAASASQKMKAMGESMASIGGKMTVGVTAPILGFAGAAIKAAADNEQLEVSFTTMLGSAEKAKNMMAELSKFAASTPFESPEIQNASKMLLAFGVSAEDIIPTMTNLGDIAAGLNIPLGDMAYLFGTTRAAGRMMTADLNQFTSRGIPMISALAKTMGIAESEVKATVEAGKVGFPEMEAALQSLTAEGGQFSGLMAAQSGTLAGLFSTFSDTIGLTMTAVGKVIIETFDLKTKLADALVWLEKAKNAILNFAKTQPQLFKLGIMFGVVAAAIGPVLVGLGMLLSAVAPLAPAFALLVSPVGLVVAALAALIAFDFLGLRTFAVNILPTVGKAIMELVAQFTGFGIEAYDTTDNIRELVFALTGSTKAMDAVDEAIAKTKGVIGNLKGAIPELIAQFTGIGKETHDTTDNIREFVMALTGSKQITDEVSGKIEQWGKTMRTTLVTLQEVAPHVKTIIGEIWTAVAGGGMDTGKLASAVAGIGKATGATISYDVAAMVTTVDWGDFGFTYDALAQVIALDWLSVTFGQGAIKYDAIAGIISIDWTGSLPEGGRAAFSYDTVAGIKSVVWNEELFTFSYNAAAGVTMVNFNDGLFMGHYTATAGVTKVLWGMYWNSYDVTGSVTDVLWGTYTHTYNAKANVQETSVAWGAYKHTYEASAEISKTNVLWGVWQHYYSASATITSVAWGLYTKVYDATAAIAETSVLWGAWSHSYSVLANVGEESILWGLFTHTYDAKANVSEVRFMGQTADEFWSGLAAPFVSAAQGWQTMPQWIADLGAETFFVAPPWLQDLTVKAAVGLFEGLVLKPPSLDSLPLLSVALPTWEWPEIKMPAWFERLQNLLSGGGEEPFGNPFEKFQSRDMIGPVEAPDWKTLFDFPDIDWPGWEGFIKWPSITWPGWLSFIKWPTISWPGWSSFIKFPSVPEFPGWSSLWAFITGTAAATAPATAAPGSAVGTSNWRGGLTWVGETGPELVALPRTSRIFSNRESMDMARGEDKSQIIIQQMVVRSDADIYSISYDLDTLKRQRKSRRR